METTDETLRALAREIETGVPGAAERYIVAARQRTTFEEALDAFVTRLADTMKRYFEVAFPDATCFAGESVAIDPNSRKANVKYVRIVRTEGGTTRSVYCFVEKTTGTILKPGGFKAPEPKRIPRGSIYALEPLAGCGPHGVAYADRATTGAWPAGVLKAETVKVTRGPALPAGRNS